MAYGLHEVMISMEVKSKQILIACRLSTIFAF